MTAAVPLTMDFLYPIPNSVTCAQIDFAASDPSISQSLSCFGFLFSFSCLSPGQPTHIETQWTENGTPITRAACSCCLHVYKPRSHTRSPLTRPIFSSEGISRLAKRSIPRYRTISNVQTDKLVSPSTAHRRHCAVQMAPTVLRSGQLVAM